MPKLTSHDYAVALYEATKGLKGHDLSQVIGKFVELLYRRQRLKQAGSIIAAFVAYAKKQNGIVDIEITSTRELYAKTINHIKKAFGDEVEAREKTDASLLGGFVVKTEDRIFDGSVRAQLQRLKRSLI